MHEEVGEVLIPAHRIADRVRKLGKLLADAYAGREPVVVAVMKGCVLFLADLVRAWGEASRPRVAAMDLEFVSAQSYEGTRPGEVRVTLPEGLKRTSPVGRSSSWTTFSTRAEPLPPSADRLKPSGRRN